MKNLGTKLKDIGRKHQVKINHVFTRYAKFQHRSYFKYIDKGGSRIMNNKEINEKCLVYTDRYFRLYGKCMGVKK